MVANKTKMGRGVVGAVVLMACSLSQAEMEPHEALFAEKKYPSAKDCQACHPKHYEEWSVSPHAYALLSPVFNSMQATVVQKTSGTGGDFCIRCHTPAGMSQGEPVFMSAMDRSEIAREGVTCVTCHRRAQPYGKVNGRIALEEGDLFAAVYGPTGGKEVQHVIESGLFPVNAVPGREGRAIHTNAVQMPQITTSGFCGSCHDVTSLGGLRLEEAFSEYKASPAARHDVSCQDCHMSLTPGIPGEFAHEPVAVVGGLTTKPRKRTNHMFVGPDYSIVHPGIFPHNPAAKEFATIREWLEFDHRAGWGRDEFEDEVTKDHDFPERWADAFERFEARDILDESEALLKKAELARKNLLKIAYQLGDVHVEKADKRGIRFSVEFKNGTTGHSVPTGFDADRLVFLSVTVRDVLGKVVFVSGDLDPNGDVRDAHSVYVHNGELKIDPFLFSLQSRFLIRMLRGGEREQVLPVNASVDPLPFARPPTHATLITGRPRGVRKHRMTIPPGTSQWADYEVTAPELKGHYGPYSAEIKIVAGMIPVNLVHAIQGVGFDFGMSAREVADAVVDGHQVLWRRVVKLKAEDRG